MPPRKRTDAVGNLNAAVAPGQKGQPAAEPAAGKPSQPVRWLVLVYRVPSEPTRLRAAVWRKLKTLGAIYLQNSVAALPADHKSERALRALRNEIIEGMGGRAQLLSSTALVGETDLVAEFNAARNDEYEEILDKCQDFHSEVEKETAVEHFTYGELEEIEADLEKLQRWYAKVKERDSFGASRADEVRDALEKCTVALQGYASLVYQADSAAM
jgi:glutathione S-transferase